MTIKTFIERPVLSIVISIAILLCGLIALSKLPVEQFPTIAPPTVEVSTTYVGADAQTVEKSVVVPLEEAINGVENMTYISSVSSNAGDAYITIFFKQGTDPDMAAVNVQNRVSTATGLLPADVTKVGVTTNKQQKSMLKAITLFSPDDSYDIQFINNFMAINVVPRLKRVTGVGDVTLLGSNYSMRLWLKPDLMAQHSLVPDDVTAALAAQNIESATGSFGENFESTFQYSMKYRGRLTSVEEFENIVIKADADGAVLRLKDIADVQLGDEAYSYRSLTNGHAGALIMVYQTAGSNATEVINEIDAQIARLSKSLPKGLEFSDVFSTKDFLDASMHQVFKTLLEAFALVVLIVFLFLQDVRSMIIPAISIIVSLVGTFIFMKLFGFSLNLLTLFALVLSIGIVVDDAIIVVEAVRARFDIGYASPFMATIDAMKGITSAIITTTLVFMAVFLPVTMVEGTSGIFYTQFGITMAAAVGVSALNALTLSPALCAIMLRPYGNKKTLMSRFRIAFDTAFGKMSFKYGRGVIFFVRHKPLMWCILLVSSLALFWCMKTTKTGLVPDEDTGSIMVNISTPPGTSLARTAQILKQIEAQIDSIDEVEIYNETAGYGLIGGAGPSSGLIILKLKHWNDRHGEGSSAQAVVDRINEIGRQIPDVTIFAMNPPLIDGYGVSNGVELNIQSTAGGSSDSLFAVGSRFVQAMMARPEISTAYSTFNVNYPQYMVEVDAVKCDRSGTTADAVLATLSGYYSGVYVSNFNKFSKLYRVMIQSSPDYRLEPASLDKIYTRTAGGMAPLSQFVTLTKIYGPESMSRFNLYSSMQINGETAAGYSSGDVINAVKEVAKTTLPKGYDFEFSGISREENETSGNVAIVFVLCLVFVYLILCGLYESFFMPFAVLLSVPCGLLGSFLFAKWMGLENNIYLQTGLIMLIGLLAKTAILVTEYAVARRQSGMSLIQAAVGAAKARFRPILMTVLSMIFGLLPLMFASGAGANGNSSLGSGVVGGLLIGIFALLFFTPALFIVFQTLQEKLRPIQFGDKVLPDLSIEAEKEEIKVSKKQK